LTQKDAIFTMLQKHCEDGILLCQEK